MASMNAKVIDGRTLLPSDLKSCQHILAFAEQVLMSTGGSEISLTQALACCLSFLVCAIDYQRQGMG